MIVYLFLFIILIIILAKNKKHEKFNNYKGVMITPNKFIYQNSYFVYGNNDISKYIFKKLVKNVPIRSKIYKNTNYNLIKKATKNNIILTSLFDFFQFRRNNKVEHLRFICNLFYESLAIISSKKNVKTLSEIKVIYIMSKNSGEYWLLNKMKEVYKYQIKSLDSYVEIKDFPKIMKGDINCIAVFSHHPNNDIKKIVKDNDYNLISIDKKVTKNRNTIDSNFYYKYRNDLITTVNDPFILITHKDSDPKLIYGTIDYIFNNMMEIKDTKDKSIKLAINYFNSSEIFSNNNNWLELHQGVIEFFKNYGYITNKESNLCRKLVGIKNCNNEVIRLNPYRLL